MIKKNTSILIISIFIGVILFGLLIIKFGLIHLPFSQKVSGQLPVLLIDYNGKEINLADFRGKLLVLNTWASWCPFCEEELSAFAEAQKKFGNRVTVIAINRAESLEISKRYSDDLGVTDTLVFLLDPEDSFYKSIDGFSMPETLFVDEFGVTQFQKRGPMNAAEISERINTLLSHLKK